MLMVKRKTTGKLAGARLGGMPREFWQDAANTIEGGILDNIVKQQQADGVALKKNARSTTLRKLALRRAALSLVDEKHRFVKGRGRSWKAKRFLPRGSGVAVGPATKELADLVRWVQEKGYTGWFGISAKTRAALKELLRIALAKIAGLARQQTRQWEDVMGSPVKTQGDQK